MGEVYAARHMRLGKRVAIKVISRRLSEDDGAIKRFAMEARTLAQIQHPAIVAVEHVGELADGRAYFVMEFLHGESLFDRLSRGRPSLAEALRIIDQMARGLEAAHAGGVTHRDLKPDNVFLVHLPGEPPIVKLVDFGLAKLAADATDDGGVLRAESTQSGIAIGTPMYMSPEQARGPDVDHRTDIYALGTIGYELVLGRPPFPHARTAPEFWAAHLSEKPPHPRSIWPGIPPQLDLALFAMLAKDPNQRPTLAQVRAVITTITAALPVRVVDRAATMLTRDPQSSPKRRWALAIAVVTLAGIAAGTALMATGSVESKNPTAPPAPASAPVIEQASPPTARPVPASTPPPAAETLPAKSPHPKTTERSTGRSTTRESTDHHGAKHGDKAAPAVTLPTERETDPPEPPPKPKPPIDRDQTINPFKHKVNP